MYKEIHFCVICGQPFAEDHHIIYKSSVKPLDKCPQNHVYLCKFHHRDHREGVHFNRKLDKKYRDQFKAWLEESFVNNYYEQEEIKKILHIGDCATRSLCKMMNMKGGQYSKTEIIKACMGTEKLDVNKLRCSNG